MVPSQPLPSSVRFPTVNCELKISSSLSPPNSHRKVCQDEPQARVGVLDWGGDNTALDTILIDGNHVDISHLSFPTKANNSIMQFIRRKV